MPLRFAKAAVILCVSFADFCSASSHSTIALATSASVSENVARDVEREARVEAALSQAGDLNMIIKALVEFRLSARQWYSHRDSQVVSKMGAELNRILDPVALREDIAIHVAGNLSDEDVAQTEAWASKPGMASINTVLINIYWTPPSPQTHPPTPARTDKLIRIRHATHLLERIKNPEMGTQSLMDAFAKALDPDYKPQNSSLALQGQVTSEDESRVLGALQGSLGHVPETDLEEFLGFAESPAGQRYFQAVSTAMSLDFGRWRKQFLDAVAANLKPGHMAASIPQKYVEELVNREVRIEPAMERSGDLDLILTAFGDLRPQVESWIQALNPRATPKMGVELDRILSPQALRESVAVEMGSRFARGGIEQVEEWAGKPQMRSINAILIDPLRSKPVGAAALPSPELREKLLRLTRATHAASRLVVTQRGLHSLAVEIAIAIDPDFIVPPNPFPTPTPSDDEVLVDRYLAPALAHIPEAEIDEYLSFAESQAGNTYFSSIRVTMGLALAPWRQELTASVKANAGRPPEEESSNFEELMAVGKQLMSRGAFSEARAVLRRAERLRPDDSEVQTLLGEAATHLGGSPRPSRGELRIETSPVYFTDAERHLSRAIELDPSNARAHSLLGRAKFLQSKDSEAEALLARAKALDPDQPWLRVNLADLASVQGRYDEAIALYREAIARPEGEPGVHYWALVRSRVAFRDSERLPEYTALGRQYMQDHPEDEDYPLMFAEHLLYSEEGDAEALKVLEQTNPRRSQRLRSALLAKALAGLAHSSYARTGEFDAQSRLWLQRAVQLTGGSEAELIQDLATEPRRVEPMVTVIRASKTPEALATAALYWAVNPRRMDVVRSLAEAGADLNAPLGTLPWPPLVQAAMSRDLELFTLLLDLGADPARARIEGEPLAEWLESRPSDSSRAEMIKLLGTR